MPHATVVQNHSDLHRTVWWFYCHNDFRVVLDAWSDEKRETKRHKFKSSYYDRTYWSRISNRNNCIPQPTIPDDVAAAALEQLRAQIRFQD